MSEANRLQARRPCANAPLFLPAPLKGGGAFVAFSGDNADKCDADREQGGRGCAAIGHNALF